MIRHLPHVALLAALALPAAALATPDARGEAEVRHLIEFVGSSGCTFIRNGDAHDAKAAADHLAMKYGKARSRLPDADAFVEHVASRSFFTGEEYRVRCPGVAEQTSNHWLTGELVRWRAAQRVTVSAATR